LFHRRAQAADRDGHAVRDLARQGRGILQVDDSGDELIVLHRQRPAAECDDTPHVIARQQAFERSRTDDTRGSGDDHGLHDCVQRAFCRNLERLKGNNPEAQPARTPALPGAAAACAVVWLVFTGCARAETTPPHAAQPEAVSPATRCGELAACASEALRDALVRASAQPHNTWRDIEPLSPDGTLNGYIEISRGEHTKWEFDIGANRREVDRKLPDSMSGYPVNYGFVPQTLSYDGDPFDVLMLGPPVAGGSLVRGTIVGILYMDDEKGPDMKVVISAVDARGQPEHALSSDEQTRIGDWFAGYKRHEADRGKWSKVLGWGNATEGRRMVDVTHDFFEAGLAQHPK
jgi:inorganic pyrophosphatase